MTRKWTLGAAALLALLLVAAIGILAFEDEGASSTTTIPQATPEQLAAAGLDELPLAPDSERVDTAAPSFSDPTTITNPLFPISSLHSALLLGNVDGHLMRVETTLLPGTTRSSWIGEVVETLASQYIAYRNGRIEEIAIDWYVQADDGSVGYLGEDVFDFEDGVVTDTEGTWLARCGWPRRDDHARRPPGRRCLPSEEHPRIVFEEVTIM